MKKIAITVAAVLTLALTGCGQPQEQTSTTPAPASEPTPASTGVYTTTGQVTAVAPDSVTISHQPVPALNWPAMTMTFKAPDQAMVAGLQNGATVEFSFRQDGADNVLTTIKPQ